jgi:hypothetical protein
MKTAIKQISHTLRFAIEEGDKVLSSCYLKVPLDRSKPAQIFKVGTKVKYRGAGLASALIARVEQWAAAEERVLIAWPRGKSKEETDALFDWYISLGFGRKGKSVFRGVFGKGLGLADRFGLDC